MRKICKLAALFAAIFLFGSASAQEGPEIQILTAGTGIASLNGEIEAPPLEKLAALELKRILENLFDAKVRINGPIFNPTDEKLILLGNPKTNLNIRKNWPDELSSQGHILKSSVSQNETPALIVGGSSPQATLWAVYELGHHFGMRYTLHEDFLPIEKPEFTIAGFDQVFEPNIKTRAWRTFDSGLAGQESWSLEDHRKLLGQLAKLKFNQIGLVVHPKKQIPAAGISVTGDSAGRSVFRGAKVFENPDFEGKEGKERIKAAGNLARGIRKAAEKLGFAVVNVPHEGGYLALENLPLDQPKGGVLPQFFTGRLPDKLAEIRKKKQEGYVAQCWIPGNLNPDVYFLSRASFHAEITPRKALDDLITPICGEGVAARLANGFAAIEEVSALIEKEDPDFAVPDSMLFMEHFESAEPAPEWWAKATKLYSTAVNEMYRGNTRARGGARPFILYHAKYFTFALHYMTAVDAARKAGIAKAAKDEAAWVENLEIAVEAMHNALGIYADVARDNSDRGVIAVLNEFAYRPLVEELNEAPLP